MYGEDATVANDYNAISGSFAYTVNSNDERLFIARFEIRVASISVVSATYNGVALTFIGRISNPTATAVEIWGLKNPASGSNTFAWTLSASGKHVAAATGMSGINQTVAWRNFTGATGNTAAPSLILAGATVEHKVIDALAVVEHGTPLTATPGAGQVGQFEDRTTGGAATSNVIGAGSIEDGAASVTMSWTLNNIRQWSLAAVEILPVVEGEIDISTICTVTPNASAKFAGKVAIAAQAAVTIAAGRVRLGVVTIQCQAALICIPEFPGGNAYLPIAVPQVLFFFSNEAEFAMVWVLQELNRPRRVNLNGHERVVLRVNGMDDKECTITDANDGVVRYITAPGEFPAGLYTAHLWMELETEIQETDEAEDPDMIEDTQLVEVDSPEFLLQVKTPAS